MISQSSSSLGAHRIRLTEPVDPSALRHGTPILAAAFRDSREFLSAASPDAGDAGRVAVRTRASPDREADVVLEIRMPRLANPVYLRARAQRRTFSGRLVLQLHAQERIKMDFLVNIARGISSDSIYPRKHPRYSVHLPVEWRPFGASEMLGGITANVSIGGVLIVSPRTHVEPGQSVVLRLRARAAAQDLVLTGVVRHVRDLPPAEINVGVMFEYRSSGEQRCLRQLLRSFGAKGHVIDEPALRPHTRSRSR